MELCSTICHNCRRQFRTKEELNEHLEKFKYTCISCGKQCKWINHLSYEEGMIEHCNDCKYCKICKIYTNDYNSHQHIVECNRCKENIVVAPNERINSHSCKQCIGCSKYYNVNSNHTCKRQCNLCGQYIEYELLWDYYVRMEQMDVLSARIDSLAGSITEVINILKYGPLSQICIDTVEKLEDTHKVEEENKIIK